MSIIWYKALFRHFFPIFRIVRSKARNRWFKSAYSLTGFCSIRKLHITLISQILLTNQSFFDNGKESKDEMCAVSPARPLHQGILSQDSFGNFLCSHEFYLCTNSVENAAKRARTGNLKRKEESTIPFLAKVSEVTYKCWICLLEKGKKISM